MVLDEICSTKKFSSNIFLHPTPKKKKKMDSFKVVYHPTFNIWNVDFNVFQRSNVYSNAFIKINKR